MPVMLRIQGRIGRKFPDVVKKCAEPGQGGTGTGSDSLKDLQGVAQKIPFRVVLKRAGRHCRHPEQLWKPGPAGIKLKHLLEEPPWFGSGESFQHLPSETLDRNAGQLLFPVFAKDHLPGPGCDTKTLRLHPESSEDTQRVVAECIFAAVPQRKAFEVMFSMERIRQDTVNGHEHRVDREVPSLQVTQQFIRVPDQGDLHITELLEMPEPDGCGAFRNNRTKPR